jgi:hypothetical protein
MGENAIHGPYEFRTNTFAAFQLAFGRVEARHGRLCAKSIKVNIRRECGGLAKVDALNPFSSL